MGSGPRILRGAIAKILALTLGARAEDSFVIVGDALRETRTIIRLEQDLIRELQT